MMESMTRDQFLEWMAEYLLRGDEAKEEQMRSNVENQLATQRRTGRR